MKTFIELLNEAMVKNFEIRDGDENINNLKDLKLFGNISNKITDHDAKKYIGSIDYLTTGKGVHQFYEMFELEDFEKNEFGSNGVFAFSSSNMHHFPRVLGQIRNGKIYFMNNNKYEDEEKVVFDGHGVRIKWLVIKNDKYKKGKINKLL